MQAHNSIEVLREEHGWKIEEGTAVSRFATHCQRVARDYAARQVEVAATHGPRLRVLKSLQSLCGDSGPCVVTQKVCRVPPTRREGGQYQRTGGPCAAAPRLLR